MASAVTTPLERQFGQMPVARADDVGVELRQLADHAAVRRSIATSTPPSRTCRRRSTRRRTCCRARCRRRRPTARATPPTRRSSRWRSARTRCRSPQVDDYADSILAQKISQVSGVGLVTLERRAEAGGARAGRSGGARRHAGSRSRTCARRWSPPTSTSPRATSTGRARTTRSPTDDQLPSAAGFRPLILAYKNGAPVRLRDVAKVIDGVENAQLAGWAGRARARSS